MSVNTVYIVAADSGLVTWDEFRKPPYSPQDYLDAYNNGINLTAAINTAHAAGASKVVLERGNYPMCYATANNAPTNRYAQLKIDGTNNLTIDGNSSCFFVIYDSVNQSPYQTTDAFPPFKLSGIVMTLINNTNLNICGLELRGDQYNRSWVVGEEQMEQTYGIEIAENNIDTSIDIVGHGFRGDAIQGRSPGNVITDISSWSIGGVNLSTGLEAVEAGAYRSQVIDLSTTTILRNAVQLFGKGASREIEFREDFVRAFFFSATGALISWEWVRQADFIFLPVGCKAIQFVAYGDARTEPTVSYGDVCRLVTGLSDGVQIKGEYYANHRGAISNLCGRAVIKAHIHDNGTTKYGFPLYSNTTRYAINCEDTYLSSLDVTETTINNCPQGVLFNGRKLSVTNCDISNVQYAGTSFFNTTDSTITGNTFNNVGSVHNSTSVALSEDTKKLRLHKFMANTIKRGTLIGGYETRNNVLVNISDNIFDEARVELVGNGENLVFNSNTFLSVKTDDVEYKKGVYVRRALSLKNNVLKYKHKKGSVLWSEIFLSGKSASDNLLSVETTGVRLPYNITPNGLTEFKGTYLELNNEALTLTLKQDLGAFLGTNNAFLIKDSTIAKKPLNIGLQIGLKQICDLEMEFNNVEFKGYEQAVDILTLNINDENSSAVHNITFKNCKFDLTLATSLFKNNYLIKGKLNIKFIGCEFVSDTPRVLRLISKYSGYANMTARAIGCKFINVINSD